VRRTVRGLEEPAAKHLLSGAQFLIIAETRQLLWTERLRRDLAPLYKLVPCRRGRHPDAHIVADELVGSELGDRHPEVAICEFCGRTVAWPNGRPTAVATTQQLPAGKT
jgi:hypothetical protein